MDVLHAAFVTLALTQTNTAIPAELKKWQMVYVAYDAQTERPSIFTAKGDGTSPKLIAKDGLDPVWSPDHKQVAFMRLRGVWVMNADGTSQKNLFTAKADDAKVEGISWGKTPGTTSAESILFSVSDSSNSSLYRIDRKGADFEDAKEESVVARSFSYSDLAFPNLSPSGKSLAYTANGDIWLSILDDDEWRTGRLAAVAKYDMTKRGGSNATCVARQLSWVPGTRKLVYEFSRMWGSGLEEIWLADFTKARDPILETEKVSTVKITDQAIEPCVSNDGKWILVTKLNSWSGLAAVSIDGKRTVKLIEKGEQGSW